MFRVFTLVGLALPVVGVVGLLWSQPFGLWWRALFSVALAMVFACSLTRVKRGLFWAFLCLVSASAEYLNIYSASFLAHGRHAAGALALLAGMGIVVWLLFDGPPPRTREQR